MILACCKTSRRLIVVSDTSFFLAVRYVSLFVVHLLLGRFINGDINALHELLNSSSSRLMAAMMIISYLSTIVEGDVLI